MLYGLSAAYPQIWLFGLIAPLPLLATALEVPTVRAAQVAFLAYFIGNIAAWAGESYVVPVVPLIAAHIAGAAVFAACVAAAAEATRRWSGALAALVFPSLVTAFYFALGAQSPHGSWGSPAYSQVFFTPMLETAAVWGLSGIAFIMSIMPAGLAVAWYRRRWNMDWRLPAVMAIAGFGIAVLVGSIRLVAAPAKPLVRVGLIALQENSQNSAAYESGAVVDAAALVTSYARLVRSVAAQGAQVVVLPEKTVAVVPRDEADVVAGFSRIASLSHVWLVVGLNQIGRTPKRNIAIVLAPDGTLAAAYGKHHLSPSLESDYRPGRQPAIFDAPWGRTAVLISKDLEFPEATLELARAGVTLVLAPAADWPGVEVLHEKMAAVRGVEGGFSIARAAREGLVSATDSRGREIVARAAPRGGDAVAVAALPLGAGPTLYSRGGDWFAHLVVALAILLVARLGVSIWYPGYVRKRRATGNIVPDTTATVSLEPEAKAQDAPEAALEPEAEAEPEIYRPPPKPPE